MELQSYLAAERIAAYKAAATRSRWFLLVTTLLSCLMFFHVADEQFSYHQHQLKQTLKRRFLVAQVDPVVATDRLARTRPGARGVLSMGPGPAVLQDLKELGAACCSVDSIRIMNKLVDHIVARIQTNNALESLSPGVREIPLLGLSVAANDYLMIMTLLMLVFVTGLWLNVRSLHATMQSLFESPETVPLMRLHFTFTGLGGETGGARLATTIQYVAFWFPMLAFLPAVVIDVWSMFRVDDPHMVAGEPSYMVMRVLLFLFSLGWLLAVSVSNTRRIRHLDRSIVEAERANASSDETGPRQQNDAQGK